MKHHYVLAGWTAALLASLVPCSSAVGQLAIGAEVGADRFWGGSLAKAAPRRSFHPYRPTAFGVNIERRAGKLALGVRLRYSSAGLALEGADGAAIANGVFRVYTVAPEVVYRLATLASVNRIQVHAGPLFEVWSILDEESETRVGIQGALSFRVPLGGGLEGSIMAGAALIPSPFAADQLDVNFERRALWRRRLAAGMEYRL
jgi:hypothetical protein